MKLCNYFYEIKINKQIPNLQLCIEANNCEEAEEKIKEAIAEMMSALAVPDTTECEYRCVESTLLNEFINMMIMYKTSPKYGEPHVIYNVLEKTFALVDKTKKRAQIVFALPYKELKYTDTDIEHVDLLIEGIADEYSIDYIII